MEPEIESYFTIAEREYAALFRSLGSLFQFCNHVKQTDEWKIGASNVLKKIKEQISSCKEIVVPLRLHEIHAEYRAFLNDTEKSLAAFEKFIDTLDLKRRDWALLSFSQAKAHLAKAGILKQAYYNEHR
jgi:hypothetical protein